MGLMTLRSRFDSLFRLVSVVQGLEHNLFTVETWIRFPSEIVEKEEV